MHFFKSGGAKAPPAPPLPTRMIKSIPMYLAHVVQYTLGTFLTIISFYTTNFVTRSYHKEKMGKALCQWVVYHF